MNEIEIAWCNNSFPNESSIFTRHEEEYNLSGFVRIQSFEYCYGKWNYTK